MRRSGFSLVELVAVIAGTAVVVGGATAILQLMLGTNGEVRERTVTIATIGRLAEQFRRDVHSAGGEPAISADQTSLELRHPRGRVVNWRCDEQNGVVRTEHGGGGADRRNAFQLPLKTTAALSSKGKAVVLRIESAEAAGPALAVIAQIGQDESLGVEEEK
jgi:hypothetical protein